MIALALAACVDGGGGPYLGGIGDPVRGAALQAPERFGDFSRWAGDPVGAARAAASLEFLADSFRTDPRYRTEVDPGVTLQLGRARDELRMAVGIAPAAAPDAVVRRLRGAADGLVAGSPVRAEAALASAEFTRPPRSVLAALASLPRLPQAATAASLAAAEIGRLDQMRR